MIENTIDRLKSVTKELHDSILLDIEDVKQAKHESLVKRNDIKLELMDNLSSLKETLNEELASEYQKGVDISIYRQSVDELEIKLREVYDANGRLAGIVLPVKEMYKEIIDEITKQNGGTLVEVRV